MIVSHKYRFIFIKTHKTAGSSMEMALGPLCGADDIITPMESNATSGIPKNFHSRNLIGRSYAKSKLLRKCINRHSPILGSWFYEHMPASRVRHLVGDDVWNSYYKFCFERNSWDKVVSYYNWKKHGQRKKLPDFTTYVMQKTHRLPLDSRLYFEDESCIVDEVLDYNEFTGSFINICKRLNIPFTGTMPREKTNVNGNITDFHNYYNVLTKNKIATEYRREINLMGYVFDSSGSAKP
ncbi:MAG: hypothetical protein H7Y36_04295 [Armatimonadetes bacterium]|nr:hypothetical protein [Akkermansiaceae bacterium]